jgi:O-antigen/teichoic acid export membrane protein
MTALQPLLHATSNRITQLHQKAFPNGSLRSKILVGALWSALAACISQTLTLLASILMARILGRTTFGELGMVNSTVSMVGTFAGLGLGVTTTKYVAQYRTDDPDRAGRVIGLSHRIGILSAGLMAIVLILVSTTTAANVLRAPHLALPLRIAAGTLFFSTLTGLQQGTLAGFQAYRSIATINLTQALLLFPLICIGTWLFGLNGALTATLITAIATFRQSHLAVAKHCRADGIRVVFTGLSQEMRIAWTFSLPALLAGAIPVPASWAANAMLASQSNGYANLALFSAAVQWRAPISFFASLFLQVILPVTCDRFSRTSVQQSQQLLHKSIVIAVATTIPFAMLIALLAPHIMSAYGPSFVDGAVVLRLVALTVVLSTICSALATALYATTRMWPAFLLNAIWALTFLGLTHMPIADGAYGLSMAYMCSYALHLGVVSCYIAILLRRLRNQELAAYVRTEQDGSVQMPN